MLSKNAAIIANATTGNVKKGKQYNQGKIKK
jgi:hypothetical protein